jgi:hypothetical protein
MTTNPHQTRRSLRLKDYDYARAGAYFIVIRRGGPSLSKFNEKWPILEIRNLDWTLYKETPSVLASRGDNSQKAIG